MGTVTPDGWAGVGHRSETFRAEQAYERTCGLKAVEAELKLSERFRAIVGARRLLGFHSLTRTNRANSLGRPAALACTDGREDLLPDCSNSHPYAADRGRPMRQSEES